MTRDEAYRILGLDPHSEPTEQDIKRSFRRFAQKYHPDHNLQSDATDLFLIYHEAYKHLLRYHSHKKPSGQTAARNAAARASRARSAARSSPYGSRARTTSQTGGSGAYHGYYYQWQKAHGSTHFGKNAANSGETDKQASHGGADNSATRRTEPDGAATGSHTAYYAQGGGNARRPNSGPAESAAETGQPRPRHTTQHQADAPPRPGAEPHTQQQAAPGPPPRQKRKTSPPPRQKTPPKREPSFRSKQFHPLPQELSLAPLFATGRLTKQLVLVASGLFCVLMAIFPAYSPGLIMQKWVGLVTIFFVDILLFVIFSLAAYLRYEELPRHQTEFLLAYLFSGVIFSTAVATICFLSVVYSFSAGVGPILFLVLTTAFMSVAPTMLVLFGLVNFVNSIGILSAPTLRFSQNEKAAYKTT